MSEILFKNTLVIYIEFFLNMIIYQTNYHQLKTLKNSKLIELKSSTIKLTIPCLNSLGIIKMMT